MWQLCSNHISIIPVAVASALWRSFQGQGKTKLVKLLMGLGDNDGRTGTLTTDLWRLNYRNIRSGLKDSKVISYSYN